MFLGVKDNSGMRFYVTQSLRPNDAGIMELGLVYTDRMAIPPRQKKFPLHGHCLPECTAVVILRPQIDTMFFMVATCILDQTFAK